uniref:Uncharacterized protein n=1 Tax=Salmo trutta TaxID=8032 RepID=A0A674A4S6_SALTR
MTATPPSFQKCLVCCCINYEILLCCVLALLACIPIFWFLFAPPRFTS